MKAKSIFQCAALLTGLLFLNVPLFAAVESDIVGYTTISMEAGKWYMITVPFESLESGDNTINKLYGNVGFGTGDVLYVLNTQGAFLARHWRQGDDASNTGWSRQKTAFNPDNSVLTPGTCVYIKKGTAGTITLAGKVSSTPTEFGLEDGSSWSIVAPVWPEGKLLNDLTWTGITTADALYRPTELGSFNRRYWFDNGVDKGWSRQKTAFNPDTTPLSVGEGVYIHKGSAGTGSITVE